MPTPEPKCDFCSSRPVAWSYECPSFPAIEIPGVYEGTSVGAWAACERCATLIEAKDWERLADRSTALFAPQAVAMGVYPHLVREAIRGVQAGFRSKMTGKRTRFNAPDQA